MADLSSVWATAAYKALADYQGDGSPSLLPPVPQGEHCEYSSICACALVPVPLSHDAISVQAFLFSRGWAMRDFAREFYHSAAWRQAREFIFQRDHGLCVRCGSPGQIVHHKTHLTPENISNLQIALGESNLELLCRDCHSCAHATSLPTAASLMFDEDGNIVPR